jgi:5'-deoxynucleotidase YfbR-like HD superfamily hydrolase
VGNRGATITLHSGGYFDFIDPQPDMIRIDDIAWGLSNCCRFSGQCLEFYSVAQHSVYVSRLLFESPKDNLDAFAGLMHDAAEAYTGDMVSPLKQLCPDFKLIEKRIEAAVMARFGLPAAMSPAVKLADIRMVRTEQRDITTGKGDDWNGLDAYEPAPWKITPWPPLHAYHRFMEEFTDLAPDGVR